jgi:Flp pilus assembly protein TadD
MIEMGNPSAGAPRLGRTIVWKLMASAAVLCAVTACTKTDKAAQRYANPDVNITGKQHVDAKPSNPLHAATTYWAQQHRKKPADAKAALNYARNLKALGANAKAMEVLDQGIRSNPKNTEIAAEYGRLALASNNIQLADRLLKQAEGDRKGADWRVLSARGTVLAKQGHHKQAQSYFIAALQKQPDAISVRNNLALSYAMSGQPQQAEAQLRQVVKSGRESPRIRQNLALVMGLQGKFDEAKQLASVDIADKQANANMTYLKNMVHPAKIAKAAPAQPAVPAPEPAAIAQAKAPAAPLAITPASAASSAAHAVVRPAVLTPNTPATPKQATPDANWSATVSPGSSKQAPPATR